MTERTREAFIVEDEGETAELVSVYTVRGDEDRERAGAFVTEQGSTQFVGPFFSYPFVDGVSSRDRLDATVHNRLLELFSGLTDRTVVRGAVFNWSLARFDAEASGPEVGSPGQFTTDMVAAIDAAPGVDAEFIVDEDIVGEDRDEPGAGGLEAALGDMLTIDRGGGSAQIMHAKYFLFSELRFPEGAPPDYPSRMDWVVAVTSANITKQQYRSPNNLLVMHGNQDLYETFLWYWNYTRRHPMQSGEDAIRRTHGEVRVYTFPVEQEAPAEWWQELGRAVGLPTEVLDAALLLATGDVGLVAAWRTAINAFRVDPVADVLSNVLKWNDRADEPTIRFAVAFWGRENVAAQVIYLHMMGFAPKVLMSNLDLNSYAAGPMVAAGVDVRFLPTNEGAGGFLEAFADMHSKYLLVDANYSIGGRSRRRQLVWTGSHNYNSSSLVHDDEVMVRVDDRRVYQAYLRDWETLWEMAERWG